MTEPKTRPWTEARIGETISFVPEHNLNKPPVIGVLEAICITGRDNTPIERAGPPAWDAFKVSDAVRLLSNWKLLAAAV